MSRDLVNHSAPLTEWPRLARWQLPAQLNSGAEVQSVSDSGLHLDASARKIILSHLAKEEPPATPTEFQVALRSVLFAAPAITFRGSGTDHQILTQCDAARIEGVRTPHRRLRTPHHPPSARCHRVFGWRARAS
jgi:hypothetical protein